MPKLTCSELADVISRERGDTVTVSQVRRNEKKWGLELSRGKDLNKRVVRYDKDEALKALRSAGVIAGANSSHL